MDLEINRWAKRALPLWTVLGGVLLLLALATLLKLGAEFFVALTLAMLLSFILAPLVRLLERWRVPRGLSVVMTVVTAFGAIALLFFVIGSQLASLAGDLPRYQTTIREKVQSLSSEGGPASSITQAVEVFTRFASEIVPGSNGEVGTPDAAGGSAPAPQRPVPVVVQEDASLLGTIGLFLSPLLHPLATLVLVLVFVLFVLASREDLRNRMIRLVGTDDIHHTTAVIDDAARRLSRLYLMQLALNTCYGAVIALLLWMIGVPSAILWGILAGVTRFIPYVGAFVGAVPPLALAFAIDPGWSMLIMTLLMFLIIEPIVGHVIEPLVFGHSTGLSPVAVVLAAAVWTLLWGPIGLVLSTPLTVLLVVVGRHVGKLEFIDVMLGDSPALSPAQIFYQRMLAGDPTEAIAQARAFLRERALATYYDEIALEALRLAHEDVARGRLTPERQEVMRRATGVLVAELDRIVSDPRPKGGGQVGSEAAAAVRAVGPDMAATARLLTPSDLHPDWRGKTAIACVAKPDTLDETVAQMLVQVLRKHGLSASLVPLARQGECKAPSDAGTRMACLSYMEPLSTLHLRHAVRMARKLLGAQSVVVGIWRERDRGIGRSLGRAARADGVVASTGAVLAIAMEAATAPEVRTEGLVRLAAE
ncbi:MAG: AI-2E family transporter [Mesorhizobium amorphae]|nr:MAG: AI-2E family transporter [Mesorhizobium amorphae]